MKPLGEVKREDNKYVKELKRDVNILTALAVIAAIIGVAVCFYNLKLSIECEELRQENNDLVELVEWMRERTV